MDCQVLDWAIQANGGGGVSDYFGLAYAYTLFFFKQKTAYEIHSRLEFRRVLFRSHIDRLGRIAHADEPHVEIPLAAPTERDGADAAELPGHAGAVPCLVKGPVRLVAAHRQYSSVGDRVAGAPGSI